MSDPTPFPIPQTTAEWITENLVHNVFQGDLTDLDKAVNTAVTSGIPQFIDWGIKDTQSFLRFLSGFLTWVPTETCSGKLIYNTLCLCYYVFDQAPLNGPPYQNPIDPASVGQQLLKLSSFVVEFANQIGSWMSTSNSLTADSIATFKSSPLYNYSEAEEPVGGFTTFNSLFSRKLKRGMRPISGATNDRIVTYPADSTFDGAWHIENRDIVKIKGLEWKIQDILHESSPNYSRHFAGGIWMHAFLNTYDYHRQHAPVAGKVVEANVFPGMAYLQVTKDPETNKLRPHRSYVHPDLKRRNGEKDDLGTLDAPDEAGYQWLQARGCVIIENDLLGYVAVLPIGMAQVSSVKLAVTKGDKVEKGQEISHFEFGGSDIVLIFQKSAEIQILGAQGMDANDNATSMQKYLVGMPLGYSTKGLIPDPA